MALEFNYELHPPCKMLLECTRQLQEGAVEMATYKADIAYIKEDIIEIKKAVGNGLKDEIKKLNEALIKFEMDSIKTHTKQEADFQVMDANNWFSKLMTISAKRVLGYGILIMLFSALSGSLSWALLKNYVFKETPGQMKQIVQATSGDIYHSHFLADGRLVIHANDHSKPAFIINSDGTSEKSPQHRLDTSDMLK